MPAFTSPGIVSNLIVGSPQFAVSLIPEGLGVDHTASCSRGPCMTVDYSRVSVALKRSVLVGCGVGLGHLSRLPPRSVSDLANAMPLQNPYKSLSLCGYRVRPLAIVWHVAERDAAGGRVCVASQERSGVNGLKIRPLTNQFHRWYLALRLHLLP